jgi:hypothetical protein
LEQKAKEINPQISEDILNSEDFKQPENLKINLKNGRSSSPLEIKNRSGKVRSP